MSIIKAEQYILNHLSPVEYGLYCDTYLCGVSVENKDRYIYSMRDKVKEWVEKNGGRFIVLSEKKVISHALNKKRNCGSNLLPDFRETRYEKHYVNAV